jgi:hypothetical protein
VGDPSFRLKNGSAQDDAAFFHSFFVFIPSRTVATMKTLAFGQLLTVVFFSLSSFVYSQTITVDATPGHVLNKFSPLAGTWVDCGSCAEQRDRCLFSA